MQITDEDIMEMLADDQMKHGERPTDIETEEMFAGVESESVEYRVAH